MLNRNDLDVLPIQHAVANASPSAWLDGLALWAPFGEAHVLLLDGSVLKVTTSAEIQAGEPVAFHPVAEILAVGATRTRARKLPGN